MALPFLGSNFSDEFRHGTFSDVNKLRTTGRRLNEYSRVCDINRSNQGSDPCFFSWSVDGAPQGRHCGEHHFADVCILFVRGHFLHCLQVAISAKPVLVEEFSKHGYDFSVVLAIYREKQDSSFQDTEVLNNKKHT